MKRHVDEPDRYEPMPSVLELPGWLWRKVGRRARIAAVATLLALVAAGVALAPSITESKRERSLAEQRQRAEQRAELVRRLKAEQRPRFGRAGAVAPSGAPAQQLAARRRALDGAIGAILLDARRRVRSGQLDGPIKRVECERFPRSVDALGAHEDLSQRGGRYSCVAVTAEFGRSRASIGGVIGHTYRLKIDFTTGRYAFCKVSGQAGPSREQLVTTPEACGGR
jgi:hypothetical protein